MDEAEIEQYLSDLSSDDEKLRLDARVNLQEILNEINIIEHEDIIKLLIKASTFNDNWVRYFIIKYIGIALIDTNHSYNFDTDTFEKNSDEGLRLDLMDILIKSQEDDFEIIRDLVQADLDFLLRDEK